MKDQKKVQKAFHESILDSVSSTGDWGTVIALAKLTTATVVPKNQDKIADVFYEAICRFFPNGRGNNKPEWFNELKASLGVEITAAEKRDL